MREAAMQDLLRRLLVAIPIAAFYALACTYAGAYRGLYLIALIAFSFVTLRDFYRLATHSRSERPVQWVGGVFSLFIILIFWNESLKVQPYFAELPAAIRSLSLTISVQSPLLTLAMVLLAFVAAGGHLLRGSSSGAMYSAGTTVFGVLYTTVPICHTALVLNLRDGLFYLWLVSWCTFMGDTAAYLAGRFWGKHKAGIFVSPNKTIEGYAGGIILNIGFTFVFYAVANHFWHVPQLKAWQLVVISIVLFLLTVLGDLIESLLKRDSGAKDAGGYLAGHGGLLDIVDSFLLTLPLSYYFLAWVQS